MTRKIYNFLLFSIFLNFFSSVMNGELRVQSSTHCNIFCNLTLDFPKQARPSPCVFVVMKLANIKYLQQPTSFLSWGNGKMTLSGDWRLFWCLGWDINRKQSFWKCSICNKKNSGRKVWRSKRILFRKDIKGRWIIIKNKKWQSLVSRLTGSICLGHEHNDPHQTSASDWSTVRL